MPLTPASRALLRAGMTTVELLHILVAARRYPDAVLVLASSLSPYDAIWWATLSALALEDTAPDPRAWEPLDLAAIWWSDGPSPHLCERAASVARRLELETAASWVAFAIATFEGAGAAPEPAPHITAAQRAVVAAINLAATTWARDGRPPDYTSNLLALLRLGGNVACGAEVGYRQSDLPRFYWTAAES